MSHCFTTHAQERAKERYGLELNDSDLWKIFQACLTGTAVLQRGNRYRYIYILTYRNVRMVAVLNGLRSKLITFLPSEAVQAGARVKHHRAKGRVKQVFSVAHNLDGRQYRRQKVRIAEIEDTE